MNRELVMFLVGLAIGLWIALAVLGFFGSKDQANPVMTCCCSSCDGGTAYPGVPLPGENRQEGDEPGYYCSLDEEGEPIVVDDEGEPVVVDDTSESNQPDQSAPQIVPPGQRRHGDYFCATDAEGEPIVVDDEGEPVVVDDAGASGENEEPQDNG